MSSEMLITISPSTNTPVLIRSATPEFELSKLPSNAQAAFRSFRASRPTLKSRQEIVARALKGISEETDILAKELTEQMGRPIKYTAVEIKTAVKRGEYLNQIAGEILDKDVPGQVEEGFKRYIRREPVGVVLTLFAWNVRSKLSYHLRVKALSEAVASKLTYLLQYPYLILVNSLIPAILAGNAVILKPSPQTPTIVEHISRIFLSAGVPQNVIQYFHAGSLGTIESLVRDPLINHICFTGSVAGGLAVQKAASDRVVNVGLELGGKDPAYVREDVDVTWAAEEIVDGAVFNSGQSCCAIERVYVHERIYDAFIEAVKTVLSGYKLGDPMDQTTNVGPVISKAAKANILKQIQDAVDAGAKDETPENASFSNTPAEGNYVRPTLLSNVSHSMSIMRDETFGPVIPVMKVSSDDEAIKLMNDSEFGLTASIWTKNMEVGEKLTERVQAGTCFVNRADYPSPVSFRIYQPLSF